jgi:hypothetical protein
VEWPSCELFFIRNGITSTEREVDAKGTLRHYRRTAILNQLLDNKSAVLTDQTIV